MRYPHLKSDIPASVVVFLVALPLCLGIALASGAPLLSGVISGIVGGLVVGFLSHSQTSVSGPAAGLAAVVLVSIENLGSYQVFLVAVVIAGAIQLIMGMAKVGFIATFIPSTVIKGLLAAIGILLILKQIPHAVGYDIDPESDFSFFQPDGENTFTELWKMLDFISPTAIVISAISILILMIWPKTKLGRNPFLPASLLVVVVGVLINSLAKNLFPGEELGTSHLVNIPLFSWNAPFQYMDFPDWTAWNKPVVWGAGISIAIIASLETLLNLEAVDKLDPRKRKSPPNRELMAQGAGNFVAGLFGGLPITSVIVRGSVNVDSGSETKLSAILHGLWLLLSVLFISRYLNYIPLSALASILLFTGYKLAKVSLFKEMYSKGWSQFLPFVITIIAIVFTDLLFGVVIGLIVSLLFVLFNYYNKPFVFGKEKMHIGDVMRLELSDQVTFFHKPAIRNSLWNLPSGSKLIIDATHASYIDFDILELLDEFRFIVAPERDISLNIFGLKDQYKKSNYLQFVNVLDKETQERLKPQEIKQLLQEGNDRFVTGESSEKYYRQQMLATSGEQNPMAVILGCIDSRTSPEIIFDTGIGDVLSIRIAGNVVSPTIIGSIEIAVHKLGAKLIVVKGHSGCGAIALTLAGIKDGNMGFITSPIAQAIQDCGFDPHTVDANNPELMKKITWQNAFHSIEQLLKESSLICSLLKESKVGIVAAYHDVGSGKVHFSEFILPK